MSDKTATHPLRAVPGFYGDHPGIQIGTYVSDGTSDEHLQLLQQLDNTVNDEDVLTINGLN